MRFQSAVSLAALLLGACSLVNPIDDIKKPLVDTGSTSETEGGSEGGPGDDGGTVEDTGVTNPEDVATVDAPVEAGPPVGIFVIGGASGDGGGVGQLAVLSAEDGHEIGSVNRYTVPAGRKLAGLAYDG